jgi:hypothetical protein
MVSTQGMIQILFSVMFFVCSRQSIKPEALSTLQQDTSQQAQLAFRQSQACLHTAGPHLSAEASSPTQTQRPPWGWGKVHLAW